MAEAYQEQHIAHAMFITNFLELFPNLKKLFSQQLVHELDSGSFLLRR